MTPDPRLAIYTDAVWRATVRCQTHPDDPAAIPDWLATKAQYRDAQRRLALVDAAKAELSDGAAA
jgi:hypothetical protein